MTIVEITSEPVELYKILKFEGIVSSGAEAKSVIADGQVLVNNEIETRKRKKIISGDIIEFADEKMQIQLSQTP
ncbi:MAG: RNA-binding S4 domain-containing protein [Gammaproteobacteria bacterium]